jgi:hypothetical protein
MVGLQLLQEGELEGEDGVAPEEPSVQRLDSFALLYLGHALPRVDVEPFPFELGAHPHVHDLQGVGEEVSHCCKAEAQPLHAAFILRFIL